MNPRLLNPLYTWRDVELSLRDVEQPLWTNASADLEVLSVTCAPGRRQEVMAQLSDIFGNKLLVAADGATLDLESTLQQPRRLQVLIEESADGEIARPRVIRPLWSDAKLFPGPLSTLPQGSPEIAAFYSYKGGVGRTTTLLATLGALLEQKPPQPVLVVDADLEAPGLTFDIPGPNDRFCLLDFLALVHDADEWQEVIPLAAERLMRNREGLELPSGRAAFFFLPSHRNDEQLFSHPLAFEQVVRARGRAHVIVEAVAALGKAVGARVVLIDLRAGVTEISSPLLLDSRVQSILVTSTGRQAHEGTLLVIERMRERFRGETSPEVVLSMIPKDLSENELAGLTGELKAAMLTTSDDLATEAALPNVHEVHFTEALLRYVSVAQLLGEFVAGTDLGQKTGPALARLLMPRVSAEEPGTMQGLLDQVAREAKKLEYAEANAEPGLLATPALAALFHEFPGQLPAAVVLGAKGAGKTFAWGQMIVARDWRDFFTLVARATDFHPSLLAFARGDDGQSEMYGPDGLPVPAPPAALVFPLLGSRNMQPPLQAKVREAEQAVWAGIGQSADTTPPLTGDALHKALNGSLSDNDDELQFWTARVAARLGLPTAAGASASTIAAALAERNVAVCLAIDGLEDAFQPSPQSGLNSGQQRLLRGLLQGFIPAVRELRSPHLGVVTFVRRDLAQDAIPQNFPQFAALHDKVALRWTPTEALRLVAWLLVRAGANFLDARRIPAASYDELRGWLAIFWGEKMGPLHSKEALTDRWVIAALSDFQGRLQARDVVRLVYFAADALPGRSQLTPRALRDALVSCSKEKIRELERETEGLREIFAKFRNASVDERKIPFQASDFGLDSEEIAFLESQGVLIQVKEGELYLPEIVRLGMDFKTDRRGRAKVLALYRAAQARRV
jgi:cellulose biosynthesis protein BcsQ